MIYSKEINIKQELEFLDKAKVISSKENKGLENNKLSIKEINEITKRLKLNQEWYNFFERIIDSIPEKLISNLDDNQLKKICIFGSFQSGKTYFMQQFIEKNSCCKEKVYSSNGIYGKIYNGNEAILLTTMSYNIALSDNSTEYFLSLFLNRFLLSIADVIVFMDGYNDEYEYFKEFFNLTHQNVFVCHNLITITNDTVLNNDVFYKSNKLYKKDGVIHFSVVNSNYYPEENWKTFEIVRKCIMDAASKVNKQKLTWKQYCDQNKSYYFNKRNDNKIEINKHAIEYEKQKHGLNQYIPLRNFELTSSELNVSIEAPLLLIEKVKIEPYKTYDGKFVYISGVKQKNLKTKEDVEWSIFIKLKDTDNIEHPEVSRENYKNGILQCRMKLIKQ